MTRRLRLYSHREMGANLYLRRGSRGVPHHQIESSRPDLSEPAVAIQRNGHGDRRIVSLELHSARDQQIVELINMKRFACLPQKEGASLSDRTVRKSITDRGDIVVLVWNTSLAQVRNGTGFLRVKWQRHRMLAVGGG